MKEARIQSEELRPEVVFLSAPHVFPPRPSLALSFFKTCLAEEGMSSVVLYPMFRMLRLMGAELCRSLNSIQSLTLYEEYIFAHLTGAGGIPKADEYVAAVAERNLIPDPEAFLGLIRRAIKAAEACTEETAREIAILRPAVLAASSLFTQNNASLAILRRVKELAPGIRTLMGGPNCAGSAGAAILRFYPQVDAVYFGEGDEGIARACRALAEDDTDALPYGVVRRSASLPDPLPYAMTRDMNRVPYPDFSDYLQQLHEAATPELRELLEGPFFGTELEPILQVEGSRGCWWGEKHPCSFCGLNGERNIYRAKTPQRLLAEIKALSSRFGMTVFELTDNVLSRDTVHEFPALLEAEQTAYRFVAEVKPNLRDDDLAALRRGGFVSVQAGIENLQDHLLQLMNKGGSAVQNVAFIILCMQNDIDLMWNFLFGIPGESAADYEELRELLPKLTHLRPPQVATPIIFQRYSRYLQEPGKYGLVLRPNTLYPFLYGDNPEMIRDLAFYYDLTGGKTFDSFQAHFPLYEKLRDVIRAWQQSWVRDEAAQLVMLDRGDYVMMLDSRPCKRASVSFLRGAEAEICRFCRLPASPAQIVDRLCGQWPEKRIQQALDWLTEHGYLVFLSGKYLLIALKGREND